MDFFRNHLKLKGMTVSTESGLRELMSQRKQIEGLSIGSGRSSGLLMSLTFVIRRMRLVVTCIFVAFLCAVPCGATAADGNASLYLSDEVVPWDDLGKDFVERPKPVTEVIEDAIYPENKERDRIIKEAHVTGNADLLETAPERRNIFGGNPFLGSGKIDEGFEIATGAVWQPNLIIYGEFRTAIQSFDGGFGNDAEWANRLDIFGNLYLTPTERILIGFRPLDRDGDFTGYQFNGVDKGFFETLNATINTFFFEGDFGELFPRLDPNDSRSLDYGIAFGRQPINFQDGIMINDTIDSIGISRASLFSFGANATRITGLLGLNELHRGDNIRDSRAKVVGLLTSMDYDKSTLEVDAAYVEGSSATGGDGFYAGIGDTRRISEWNSTLRVNGSWALNGPGSLAVDSGFVITSMLSRTMTYNDDIFYFDSFYGNGNYTSVARDPSVGGPLGGIGILYASAGLGDYSAPLGNQVGNGVGFASGYQAFLGGAHKAQLIYELGGRAGTRSGAESSLGFGMRYQRAFGQHSILRLDGFAAGYNDDLRPLRDDFGWGLRCEWRVKF